MRYILIRKKKISGVFFDNVDQITSPSAIPVGWLQTQIWDPFDWMLLWPVIFIFPIKTFANFSIKLLAESIFIWSIIPRVFFYPRIKAKIGIIILIPTLFEFSHGARSNNKPSIFSLVEIMWDFWFSNRLKIIKKMVQRMSPFLITK